MVAPLWSIKRCTSSGESLALSNIAAFAFEATKGSIRFGTMLSSLGCVCSTNLYAMCIMHKYRAPSCSMGHRRVTREPGATLQASFRITKVWFVIVARIAWLSTRNGDIKLKTDRTRLPIRRTHGFCSQLALANRLLYTAPKMSTFSAGLCGIARS